MHLDLCELLLMKYLDKMLGGASNWVDLFILKDLLELSGRPFHGNIGLGILRSDKSLTEHSRANCFSTTVSGKLM